MAIAAAAFLLSVVGAMIVNLLSDEVSAWMSHASDYLLRRAAARMSDGDRERYLEEWRTELELRPGASLSRMLFAIAVRVRRRGLEEALGVRSAGPLGAGRRFATDYPTTAKWMGLNLLWSGLIWRLPEQAQPLALVAWVTWIAGFFVGAFIRVRRASHVSSDL